MNCTPRFTADPSPESTFVGVALAENRVHGQSEDPPEDVVNDQTGARSDFAVPGTGTDLERDLYPHLVASAVMAAVNTATAHHLRTDATEPVARLLTDALRRIAPGLSAP